MSQYFSRFGHKCNLKSEKDIKFEEFLATKTPLERFLIKNSVVDPLLAKNAVYLKSYASIVNEREAHVEKYLGVIHPLSKFKAYWEIVFAVATLTSILYKPFQYLNYLDKDNDNDVGNLIIIWFVTGSCILDIVVRFSTGYYDQKLGSIVLDRKKIAISYIKGFFIIDFLTNVPLLITSSIDNTSVIESNYLKLLALLRVFRILTMLKYIKRILMRFELNDKAIQVMFLCATWAICIHWTTVFITLPVIIRGDFDEKLIAKNSWVREGNFQDAPLHEKYFDCLYKIVKYFSGLGFSTEHTENIEDQMYALFLVIFGRIGLWVTFATIYNIVKEYKSSTLRYEEMMTQVDTYAKQNKIPKVTKSKLKANCSHIYQKKFFNEGQIMETVSPSLRHQITMFNTRKLVENSTFFKNLPSSLIVKILLNMHMQLFLENDVIYTIGRHAQSIYFITTGSCALYSPTGKEICHYQDGDHFGEVCLMANRKTRFCSVVALETTECFRLGNETFKNVLASYPDLLNEVQARAVNKIENIMIIEERSQTTTRQIKKYEEHPIEENRFSTIRPRTSKRKTIFFE